MLSFVVTLPNKTFKGKFISFLPIFSDLSGNKELKNVIIESFSSSSEEVKSAASFALGMWGFFCERNG